MQEIGLVILNGETFWNDSYCLRNSTSPSTKSRGVTIFNIDPYQCRIIRRFTFDTNHEKQAALGLGDYIALAHDRSVIVGVTAEEPTDNLLHAHQYLMASGVNVNDVEKWGSFTFVIQKGYAYKTKMSKRISKNRGAPASLDVVLSGKQIYVI